MMKALTDQEHQLLEMLAEAGKPTELRRRSSARQEPGWAPGDED